MKRTLLLLNISMISLGLFSQNLKEQLFHLPDVIFDTIATPEGFKSAYLLKIKQPLDHENPDKGFFYQRAYLSHKGFNKPTVMVTNGYSAPANRISEVASLLDANQLSIEHRYFGESMPDSINYEYLNLKQASGDLHHINELFRSIYASKWLSTGISKGGSTTIFYRYFYPDDVDVSIPYVAPLNTGVEDSRIYQFLDTVGTDECRAKLKAIQKRILTERDEVLPLLRWYSYGAQLNFSYLTFEQAFEYQVLEFPFSFWQWGGDCNQIPDPTSSTLEEVLYYFVSVSGLDFFADKGMTTYASHYYQAGAEMGYYGYDISELKDLIKALPTDQNPSAVFMPNKMKTNFNNVLLKDTRKWLEKNGNHFIYINGNSDTWSATAVRPTKGIDALWYFLPHKHHGAARIKNMTDEERKTMIKHLERWLKIEIE